MAVSRAVNLAHFAPSDVEVQTLPVAGGHLQIADGAASPVASHARTLQDQLAQVFDPAPLPDSPHAPVRWPPAATLGFILATCGTFWVGAAALLVHAIG